MKIFYGWRVVMAAGALQFLQSLLLNQAFGVYLAVLVEERGWSKTAVAGAAALKSTEVAVLGPVLSVAGLAGARDGAEVLLLRPRASLLGKGRPLAVSRRGEGGDRPKRAL